VADAEENADFLAVAGAEFGELSIGGDFELGEEAVLEFVVPARVK
jgi:hypothetical protein